MAPKVQVRLYKPPPKDEREVRDAFTDLDEHGGVQLSAEETKAYLQWLETGEGPCPIDGG